MPDPRGSARRQMAALLALTALRLLPEHGARDRRRLRGARLRALRRRDREPDGLHLARRARRLRPHASGRSDRTPARAARLLRRAARALARHGARARRLCLYVALQVAGRRALRDGARDHHGGDHGGAARRDARAGTGLLRSALLAGRRAGAAAGPAARGSGKRLARALGAPGAWSLLALPWVRRSLPETRRFTRAVESGSVAPPARATCFTGPYRRRAIGLLAAWTLRPIGVTAVLTYLFYHGVGNLALSPAVVTGDLHRGRRRRVWPGFRSAHGSRIAGDAARRSRPSRCSASPPGSPTTGCPPISPGIPALALGACFAVNQIAFNAYNVAERCLDTELFPTALRATYAGSTRLGQAIATIVANFAVSALASSAGRDRPRHHPGLRGDGAARRRDLPGGRPGDRRPGLDEASLEQAPARARRQPLQLGPFPADGIPVVSRIPGPRRGPLSQSTGAPKILLLHDGELADVAALLTRAGRRDHRAPRRAGAAGRREQLASGARERAPRARSPDRICCARAPSGSPSWTASREPCAPCFARASFELVVRRPVHPVALRLLLLHALYRGPEKRRTPRVSVGAPVHFRAGLLRHRAILAEISERGCRLLTSQRAALGQTLTLQIPAALAGGSAFSVKGLVVRMIPAQIGSPGVLTLEFDPVPPPVRVRLRAVVSAHRVGPSALAREGADARPPRRRARRSSPRRPSPRGRPSAAASGRAPIARRSWSRARLERSRANPELEPRARAGAPRPAATPGAPLRRGVARGPRPRPLPRRHARGSEPAPGPRRAS